MARPVLPRPFYLFSIDVEDIRLLIEDGERYRDAVPGMTSSYLDFLRARNLKATFFVVGEVARRHPTLVQRIVDEGHEVGCHTDTHIPLNLQSKESFQEDLERNVESLQRAGAKKVLGFRAPIFSLTEKTSWAYDVLARLGFCYSSSVLPASNPLYGWKEFGEEVKTQSGIVEIPMTISHLPGLRVPFGGGLYFRVLPLPLLKYLFRTEARKWGAIGGYFHPYDIDTEQESFMHPGIHGNKFYNWLMYRNRDSVFRKLESILRGGFQIATYEEYLSQIHQMPSIATG